jgi:hypothetical protein
MVEARLLDYIHLTPYAVLESISSPKIMSDCLPRQSDTLAHVPGTDYSQVRSVTQLVWSLPVVFLSQLDMLILYLASVVFMLVSQVYVDANNISLILAIRVRFCYFTRRV